MRLENNPHWPLRLAQLVARVADGTAGTAGQSDRAEMWLLMSTALRQFAERHAAGLTGIDPSDLDDVASDKSLELLASAEQGKWTIGDRGEAEVSGYLSRVARNGLMDHLRRRSRNTLQGGTEMETKARAGSDRSDALAESRDFSEALVDCAEGLRPAAFLAWYFRVFYDMTTKEIAGHPEVNLKPGHVDVLLQRSRESISRCMGEKGHDASHVPRGAFTELWKHFRRHAEARGWSTP